MGVSYNFFVQTTESLVILLETLEGQCQRPENVILWYCMEISTYNMVYFYRLFFLCAHSFHMSKKILRCMPITNWGSSCKPLFHRYGILTLPSMYTMQFIIYVKTTIINIIKTLICIITTLEIAQVCNCRSLD